MSSDLFCSTASIALAGFCAKRMPKSQLKKSSVSWKRISKEKIDGSASKSLKVTIYRKVTYYKQNHFVRYCLKNSNFKDHRGKESRKHFSKKKEINNGNAIPKFISIKKPAIETVPTFLGLPLEVSPPPSPTYSCEAEGKFDCYDFPMSWDENETIVPFENGKKRKAPILDTVFDFEDFKWSPLSKKKPGSNFVDNTLEPKNAVKKVYEKECKWCLKLFYTKKSENIFCKKCNKLKDGDADKKESKKVKWKIINTKFEGEKEPIKSSKVTNGDSKSSRSDTKAMRKEKFKSGADTKTLSKKKKKKSSESNCDMVISQKDINASKTARNKSKALPKILGGKKRSNKDTVESNFEAAPKILGKKKRKISVKSTGDPLGNQNDKDNCDIVSSEDLEVSPTQIAKIERTWGNAVNVEKILSGIYQLTFPPDNIEIDYESLDVHNAQVEASAEDPEVRLSRVSHTHTQFPYNVSRTKNDKQEPNRVSKTVIDAKEELEAIALLAYLDMDDDIHQGLRNLDKSEYKKYRQIKKNRDLPGDRDTDALFEKRVRLQQRKLKTLTKANTLLQTHGTFTKLAETIMGQIPSEIIEDSISPNNEYITLPCSLNDDMHTSQEQLKSTESEPLTFPTAEVNLEKSRCSAHNVSDNLEIKNCIGNLVLATSSTIFALPYSTPQPVAEDSSFPANIEASGIPANIEAPGIPANIEASFVPRNVETVPRHSSHSLPESISSTLLWTAQPFAPQSDHEVYESRLTPSTGSGSGMPSRPESARLELEVRQGTPFGAIEDNMAHTTANCIVGEDCQTRSPSSCQFSQSETNQEVLQRVVQRKKGGLQQNAILEIHNHLNLQTALLYEMNQQQNHQPTHLPLNQIQSLPGFHTFSAHGQFFPHVHEQMQPTAFTHSHQQMSTSLPMYQHFNALSNHIEELASQSHPRQNCQSAVTDLNSFGHGRCNIPYNIESPTNDVTIGNRHFVNAQPCVPPPNHLQTDLQTSTYNVLEPYTSTQYAKQAKTYHYDKSDFLGLG